MGARHIAAAVSVAFTTVGLTAGAATAGGPAPDADPVVTITESVILGGTIEASMECHWVDPEVEQEPLTPTWNMVAPDGTSVVEDDVSGDAGTVMASWAASQVGEWGLFVTCGGVTEVFTSIVSAPATTAESTTTAVTPIDPTDPPAPAATLPATGGGGGSALLATGLVVAGLVAVIVARRRPA